MSSVAQLKRVLELFESDDSIHPKYINTEIEKEANKLIDRLKENPKAKHAWVNLFKLKDKSEQFIKHAFAFLHAFPKLSANFDKIDETIIDENIHSRSKLLTSNDNRSFLVMSHDGEIDVHNFDDWRSDETPEFRFQPTIVEFDESALKQETCDSVKEHCLGKYKNAMDIMEHSVEQLALEYITRNPVGEKPFADKYRKDYGTKTHSKPGSILSYANVAAQRYYDLYEANAAWEMSQKIPLIPVTAGQLKLHGFTSTDILAMQEDCKAYIDIVNQIKKSLNFNKEHANKVLQLMTDCNSELKQESFLKDTKLRDEFLNFETGANKVKLGNELCDLFKRYNNLSQKGLINKAHFLMHDFGHISYVDIADQLYYVAIMVAKECNDPEQRILMEIRHRVAGDGSIHQNSPGTLGGNALAYKKMLKEGEDKNPEAEFREKMYFVYMNNHFANAVIRDEKQIDFINKWLKKHGKGWQLDSNFIKTMKKRGVDYIPPIFRYGANAALSKVLRRFRTDEEISQYYRKNPNVSVRALFEGKTPKKAQHRYRLSSRELMNQYGEPDWDESDINMPWKPLNYGTGAAIFELLTDVDVSKNPQAYAYLKVVQQLQLPVVSGISGTLDQSTAMAGLVGLGVDKDCKMLELQTIKLAYLAFMLPGRDHSVHEIMQSSTTFGLPYVAGPGYEAYLYPCDQKYVEQSIEKYQNELGSHLPAYYLSNEYTKLVIKAFKLDKNPELIDMTDESLSSENDTNSSEGLSENDNNSAPTRTYYLGFQVSKLKSFLNEIERDKSIIDNTNAVWIDPKNLHITIGWFEGNIDKKAYNAMLKEIQELLVTFDTHKFCIESIQIARSGNIHINLKESSSQLFELRLKIASIAEFYNLTFKYARPHIRIGYILNAQENVVEDFKTVNSNKSFSFDQCALMYYDNQRGRNIVKRVLAFNAHQQRLENTLALLESDRIERKLNASRFVIRGKEGIKIKATVPVCELFSLKKTRLANKNNANSNTPKLNSNNEGSKARKNNVNY